MATIDLICKNGGCITNQHKLISSTKEMNPIMRKSMSRLSMLFCCRAIHQNPVERPTLGNLKIRDVMSTKAIYIYFFKCLPFDMCLPYSSETWLNHYFIIASLLATEDLINLHLQLVLVHKELSVQVLNLELGTELGMLLNCKYSFIWY